MVKKPGQDRNDGERFAAKGRGMVPGPDKRPAPPKSTVRLPAKGVPAAAAKPGAAIPMVAEAVPAGAAETAATAATSALDARLALALEAERPAPPLIPVRYLGKPAWAVDKIAAAGAPVVPLSHSVHEGVWAFRFTDLLAELINPAVASRVSGTVRISAKLKSVDGKPSGDPIALVQRPGPSGLRVLETRTRLKLTKATDGSAAFEPDPKGTYVAETRLVARDGRMLDKDSIEALIFKHDRYETETRGAVGLPLISTVDLVTGLHNSKGGTVELFGQAPSGLVAGEVSLSRGGAEIAKPQLDRRGRFLIRTDVVGLFGANPQIDVKLTFAPAAGGAAIDLNYRLFKEDKKDPHAADPNAPFRTRLIAPFPAGLAPADIPPLHMVLT